MNSSRFDGVREHESENENENDGDGYVHNNDNSHKVGNLHHQPSSSYATAAGMSSAQDGDSVRSPRPRKEDGEPHRSGMNGSPPIATIVASASGSASWSLSSQPTAGRRPPIVPSDLLLPTSDSFHSMRRRWEEEARQKTPGGVDPAWFLGFTPKKHIAGSPMSVSPAPSRKGSVSMTTTTTMAAAAAVAASEREGGGIGGVGGGGGGNGNNVDISMVTEAFERAAVFARRRDEEDERQQKQGEEEEEKEVNEEDESGVPRSVRIPDGILQAVAVPSLYEERAGAVLSELARTGREEGGDFVGGGSGSGGGGGSPSPIVAIESDASRQQQRQQHYDAAAAEKRSDNPLGVDHARLGGMPRNESAKISPSGEIKPPSDGGGGGSATKGGSSNGAFGAWCGDVDDSETEDSSLLDVRSDAYMIVLREDTDMRPCPAGLELDGEPMFLDLFDDGWDGRNGDDEDDGDDDGFKDALNLDSDTKGTAEEEEEEEEKELVVSSKISLDSKGLVAIEDLVVIEGGNGSQEITLSSHDQQCDASSVDFSILSDPTATESTADLSKRSLQMPNIPEEASTLPDPERVGGSGSIFARSSLRAIVMKKWHKAFWAQYGDASVYVFRSQSDFQDWLLNPYHGQRQRSYLIKARFDFRDEIVRKPGLRGFRMTDVKFKTYERKGEPMHHFKLEKWTDLGMSIVSAFASPKMEEVEALRTAISKCLAKCPYNGCRPIDDLIL